MTPTESICTELQEMGLSPRIMTDVGFNHDCAVALQQTIPTGRYKGRVLTLAIGFQEDSYPDYPPHFVYVADLPDPQIPVHSSFSYDNRRWSGFSVPPSDFWDELSASEKNMKTFVNRHLLRFWNQI